MVENHFGPAQLPETATFLDDEAYARVLDNFTIACADIIIFDESTGEMLSGFRQQKPQEGWWVSCGGRMRRGKSPQESGAFKIQQELGLEIPAEKLQLIGSYSTAFNERAQEPSENGSHTFNALLAVGVSPQERERMKFRLNQENRHVGWFFVRDVARGQAGDAKFPPALQKMAFDLEGSLARQYHPRTKMPKNINRPPLELTNMPGIPETDIVVPGNSIFVMAPTSTYEFSNDTPYQTRIQTLGPGRIVEGKSAWEGSHWLSYLEGLMLAKSEAGTITRYILGYPFQNLVENVNGQLVDHGPVNVPRALLKAAHRIYEEEEERLFANDRFRYYVTGWLSKLASAHAIQQPA